MNDLKLDESGGYSSKPPKPTTPKAIEAWGTARDSFTRLIICGVVLVLLVVCFILALWKENQYARDILLVIGSTLGFLVGRESSSRGE